MAVVKLSSVTRSAYSSAVGGYIVEYTIAQNTGERAETINGIVRSSESPKSLPAACNVYAGADGSMNINFNPGISSEDKTLIFSSVVADVDSIFKELNETE